MRSRGDWASLEGIATSLLDGSPIAIAITVFIAFGLPVLLHLLFYRTVASPPSSNFLLLGPHGAGKTALLTLLESKSLSTARKDTRVTHTSQTSTTAIISLPASVPTASNRYRSVNDTSLKEIAKNPVKYRLRDTPGHGKLRESQGISQLLSMSMSKDAKSKLRGVLYVVDTAVLAQPETLRDTANYLYDVLLILQKRAFHSGRKAASEVPVLVAANKQDLFTALPPASVREKLEDEINRLRNSRTNKLLDASVELGVADGEDDILGSSNPHDKFSFRSLKDEVGIAVDVIGGAVMGDEESSLGAGVRKWEEWIGQCL
ncbi:signal recognition particle receptor subunit beta [Aspergillus saccharolyticus JOP 1030-1]|uniref:Signal recognition particle receptor subunit beta n=1 Tax=Aspergillus saccharolyticus JOP 1030-1 TaxID=1450539 RepID=A0A318Z5Z5_9EURO|nr:P-loop containing nucleoside triphosphate hydrolase protein [Aspergillus saccharolyticus JOP 1030-1]PYH41874.1 P-loop containing nucleoside triphosphate hydrolase protein [Aspergillus saccharolyticus JOP 1030-1]